MVNCIQRCRQLYRGDERENVGVITADERGVSVPRRSLLSLTTPQL